MRALIFTFTALCLITACGADPPEERLDEAGESLEDAREERSEARNELESARARVAAAEQELHDARRALRDAEKRVAAAGSRVEQRATDVALFRAVQSRILRAEPLEEEAIGVRVEQGVVTLQGRVSDPDARDVALEVARSTPGVERVRDRLELQGREGG